jgi:hypothetical protein
MTLDFDEWQQTHRRAQHESEFAYAKRAFDAALASNKAAAVAVGEPTLDKPAKVGGTRFGKGVKWSTVIGAAQRHYEYEVTPEKEAARIARAKVVIESIQHGDYSALSAETVPFGYLHKFANPTRPHDPIERFSKYRFQKPNELAENVIECIALYTHPAAAQLSRAEVLEEHRPYLFGNYGALLDAENAARRRGEDSTAEGLKALAHALCALERASTGDKP